MVKKRFIVRLLHSIVLSSLFFSCLDPYNPPIVSSDVRLMVIDGRIINGQGPTIFKLSRTRGLVNDTTMLPESEATVRIESESNNFFELPENVPGIYTRQLNNLDQNQKYRLHVQTSAGKEYYSEWVELKKTPEIDSVTWEKKSDGVQIYTTTHDPEGKTKYYQYEFEETWKFRSFAESYLKYINGKIIPRPADEPIYECYDEAASTVISLATSETLNEDVIYKNPLIFVPAYGTNKLSVRYSILVRQFAISKEAFQYWQNLKKVTEDIGSLFDPQPSTFKGNVYCASDENELVLGFVSACDLKEKRIFIDRKEYGLTSNVFTGYEDCKLDSVPGNSLYPRQFNPGDIPVEEVRDQQGNKQLLSGSPGCIDCRERGTATPPSFWQ